MVYGASPSPWGHAQPWGDVTRTGNTLNLVVFDWPADRQICLSGLDGKIAAATLHRQDGKTETLPVKQAGTWAVVDAAAADPATVAGLAGLIELKFDAAPKIDQTLGIHPNIASHLSCEFSEARNASKGRINWMEKFGEWKFSLQVGDWKPGGAAEWDVDVAKAGDYHVELVYKGDGRPVWAVSTSEGAKIQNQQAATPCLPGLPDRHPDLLQARQTQGQRLACRGQRLQGQPRSHPLHPGALMKAPPTRVLAQVHCMRRQASHRHGMPNGSACPCRRLISPALHGFGPMNPVWNQRGMRPWAAGSSAASSTSPPEPVSNPPSP